MLHGLRARAGTLEKTAVAALFAIALAVYAFVEIAEEAMEKGTHAFDKWVLLALRSPTDLSDPLGPPWFEEMMRDFTALGGTGVLVILVLGVVGFLTVTGKRRAASAIAISIAGGLVLSHSLKWGFARPRPDLVPHGSYVYTRSFPSGHAMMSAIVYLTLGMMLTRTQAAIRAKIFILVFAGLLTLLVGSSRVYLGVHWPTDVLAGWAGGAGWALASWLVMYWLQQHGDVEPEEPAAPQPGSGEIS